MSLKLIEEKIPIKDFELNVYHHIVDKQAATIVFLHDSLGSITVWRDFPEKLCTALNMNCFVYERRGHGLSSPFAQEPRKADFMTIEADILMEVLRQCGVQNPILFGHSDGATIALLAAAQFPDRIKAVISEAAHVFVEEITLDGIKDAIDLFETTNLKERLEHHHGDKAQALFDAWTNIWQMPEYRNWNVEQRLSAIVCPVMVIQGTEDEYGSMAQVDAIANGVSGIVEKCVVINAGHTPHRQNEIWILQQCSNFIKTNIR